MKSKKDKTLSGSDAMTMNLEATLNIAVTATRGQDAAMQYPLDFSSYSPHHQQLTAPNPTAVYPSLQHRLAAQSYENFYHSYHAPQAFHGSLMQSSQIGSPPNSCSPHMAGDFL